MELRDSPIQMSRTIHLNNDNLDSISRSSRSGSLSSQQAAEMVTSGQHHHHHHQRRQANESRPHSLDLYSVPVFILELLVLVGLGFAAYYLHYEYYIEPYLSGFYCDDITIRQQFAKSEFTRQFIERENELVVLTLLIAVPVTIIVFCELVNSLFGSLRFRKIRALCQCCKLHSITRRSIRFCGAYLLGFFIVSIACEILASRAAHLRPYFQSGCMKAFEAFCSTGGSQPHLGSDVASAVFKTSDEPPGSPSHPKSLIISHASTDQTATSNASLPKPARLESSRIREVVSTIPERQWVDLTNVHSLVELCNFSENRATPESLQMLRSLAQSWPSHPAAMVTYACLFLASYLSFAGTARPVRIISCVLVLALMIVALSFDVQLVKEHFHHWDDIISAAVLSGLVVLFVIIVYLNFFRDTHYYERQKLYPQRRVFENVRPYSGNSAFGNYNMNKINDRTPAGDEILANGGEVGEANDANANAYNNDLAMRYFQIPRANYRGAPRPISSLNQVR